MSYTGFLSELKFKFDEPVEYFLSLDEERIPLNQRIGKNLEIRFLGKKACCACGRMVNKLYNNGYCYPCFTKLAECDLCIMKPNECHFHLGTCRDNEFAEKNCMTPHYVYLAVSSGLKVGLTRKSRGKARWIDQGAIHAIPIAETPTRKIAGDIEFFISQYIPDKTNWRNMLSGKIDQVNLLEIRERVRSLLPSEYQGYLLDDQEIFDFAYPVQKSLEKIKSFSLDKMDIVNGQLMGIKGQYLILNQGVINIKKHTGYKVEILFP